MTYPALSSKLGLLLDPDGPITTSDTNWDRIDETAGVMYGTKTIPVPTNSLYDGALVAETDTEIMYRTTGSAGNFTKQWFYYPFLYCADTPATLSIAHSTTTTFGWSQFSGINSINCSTAANMGPSPFGFKCSIKGLYLIRIMIQYTANTAGSRRAITNYNGGDDLAYEGTNPATASSTSMVDTVYTKFMNVGDIILGRALQTSGVTLSTCYSQIWATLLWPVP